MKSEVDITHRRRVLDRAVAHRFDRVATRDFFEE
jgi:hypothetical protein